MKFIFSFLVLISTGLALASSIDPLESQKLTGNYTLIKGKVEHNDKNFCTPKISISVSANEMYIDFSGNSQFSGMTIPASQNTVCEQSEERYICTAFYENGVVQTSTAFAGTLKKISSTLTLKLSADNTLLFEKETKSSIFAIKNTPDFSCTYKKI